MTSSKKSDEKKPWNLGTYILAIVVIALALFAYSILESFSAEEDGNVGSFCVSDAQCTTPFSYLVQSNCPFSSACLGNRCRVVCPLFVVEHDPVLLEYTTYNISCSSDNDCDCRMRTSSVDCVCHGGACMSVEA